MKISEVFNELGWIKKIIDKVEEDYVDGIVSVEEVKHAIKNLNRYLDFIEQEVENM